MGVQTSTTRKPLQITTLDCTILDFANRGYTTNRYLNKRNEPTRNDYNTSLPPRVIFLNRWHITCPPAYVQPGTRKSRFFSSVFFTLHFCARYTSATYSYQIRTQQYTSFRAARRVSSCNKTTTQITVDIGVPIVLQDITINIGNIMAYRQKSRNKIRTGRAGRMRRPRPTTSGSGTSFVHCTAAGITYELDGRTKKKISANNAKRRVHRRDRVVAYLLTTRKKQNIKIQ